MGLLSLLLSPLQLKVKLLSILFIQLGKRLIKGHFLFSNPHYLRKLWPKPLAWLQPTKSRKHWNKLIAMTHVRGDKLSVIHWYIYKGDLLLLQSLAESSKTFVIYWRQLAIQLITQTKLITFSVVLGQLLNPSPLHTEQPLTILPFAPWSLKQRVTRCLSFPFTVLQPLQWLPSLLKLTPLLLNWHLVEATQIDGRVVAHTQVVEDVEDVLLIVNYAGKLATTHLRARIWKPMLSKVHQLMQTQLMPFTINAT